MNHRDRDAVAAMDQVGTGKGISDAFGPGNDFLWRDGKLYHSELLEQETGGVFPGWKLVEDSTG